jgi:hypothetical protein
MAGLSVLPSLTPEHPPGPKGSNSTMESPGQLDLYHAASPCLPKHSGFTVSVTTSHNGLPTYLPSPLDLIKPTSPHLLCLSLIQQAHSAWTNQCSKPAFAGFPKSVMASTKTWVDQERLSGHRRESQPWPQAVRAWLTAGSTANCLIQRQVLLLTGCRQVTSVLGALVCLS